MNHLRLLPAGLATVMLFTAVTANALDRVRVETGVDAARATIFIGALTHSSPWPPDCIP